MVLPPLRKRKDDVSVLLQHFLGSDYKNITPEEKMCLLSYDWPGNIRELENFATYYKTLSALPEYILQQNTGGSIFADSTDINSVILDIISKNTEFSHGIGRSILLQLLKKKGIGISDGKLRSLLSQLEADGLIKIGKGRYGTQITEAGISALEESRKAD